MAIGNLTEDEVKRLLAESFTPSDTIKTRERLFGRDSSLTLIDRALNSSGRQIFIFGDRGVGKTSLALTAAHIHTSSRWQPIHVNCGSLSGFGEVLQAVGYRCLPVKERFLSGATKATLNAQAMGVGASYSPGAKGTTTIPQPTGVNDALDIVRYVAEQTQGAPIVVVIDEMERLNNASDKNSFAEFIKNLPGVAETVKFIFCGIASDLTELLGAHPSAGRVLETIGLQRLRHDSLWQIIISAAEKLDITVPREILIRISQISDGFPHYVHLIGDSLFWTIFDEALPIKSVTETHFRRGVDSALLRSEPILKAQYDQATKKTKNTSDYEETLWALADRSSDRRQITDIYELSYLPMMMRRNGRTALDKNQLNQRLLALRKDSHGRIVMGYGSGWFGFRENIMRGYVRLDAEQKGVRLGVSNWSEEN